MQGDVSKFQRVLRPDQTERIVEQHQPELPMSMPKTEKPDAIGLNRQRMRMDEEEKSLAGMLMLFHIIAMISTPRSSDVGKEAALDAIAKLVSEYETELINKHRAIVARKIAASQLPVAGNIG